MISCSHPEVCTHVQTIKAPSDKNDPVRIVLITLHCAYCGMPFEVTPCEVITPNEQVVKTQGLPIALRPLAGATMTGCANA